MKKYKPILFSTPMVQAILEGRKTQTRRIVKKKYINTDLEFRTDKYGTALVEINKYVPPIKMPDGRTRRKLRFFEEKIPNYQVGDILWVRETWDTILLENEDSSVESGYVFKANEHPFDRGNKWKPSIHMPRAAARIFLEVVSVRAERLQDISDDDAYEEGVFPPEYWDGDNDAYIKTFRMVWEELYGKISWIKNPFVWVYEFKRIEKPKDFNDNGK